MFIALKWLPYHRIVSLKQIYDWYVPGFGKMWAVVVKRILV